MKQAPESSGAALSQSSDDVRMYDLSVCSRTPRFHTDDSERLSIALNDLEASLYRIGFSLCESRILVCLILYDGLTQNDIQSLTLMKQSAVSRTLASLKDSGILNYRIGKKFEVGRPYQYISLNIPLDQLILQIREMIVRCNSSIDFLEGIRDDNRRT